MFAFVVERGAGSPGFPDYVQIFVGALITFIVAQEVAVALLFGIVAATDDMHRQATVAELIQGSQLARGQGRRYETGPVRQQDAEPFGLVCDVGGYLKAIHRAAAMGHQHPVETGVLVRTGDGADKTFINHRAVRQKRFGSFLGGGDTDEFDAHVKSLCEIVEGQAARTAVVCGCNCCCCCCCCCDCCRACG